MKTTRCIGLLTLFIVVVLGVPIDAADNIATNPSSPQVITAEQPIECPLSPSDAAFHAVTQDWVVDYDHAKQYRFSPDKTQKFSLQACSNQTICGILILDSNRVVKGVGRQQDKRHHRRHTLVDLTKGQEYVVVVGTGAITTNIPVRILLSEDTKRVLPFDEARIVSILSVPSQQKGTLTKDSQRFETQWADIYSIKATPQANEWVEVRLHSGDFDPRLYVLDQNDSVFDMNDDAGRRTRDSAIVLKPSQIPAFIAVTAYDEKKLSQGTGAGSYLMTTRTYRYDPSRGIVGWLEYQFTNPLINFAVAGFLGIAVSYFFFWKALRLKRICYEVLTDRLLIDDRGVASPLLKLNKTDTPLTCASHVRVKLWHAGHARITPDFVKTPLALVFGNVGTILHVSAESSTGGWESPIVSSPDGRSIQLSFRALDPGDKLIVSAICEQAEPGIISVNLRGEVAEAKIESREEALSLTALWLIVALNAVFILVAPILLLDAWLDFMPLWFAKAMFYLWVPVVLLHLAFFIFTRRGRRTLMSLLSAVIHDHPGRLLATRRAGSNVVDDSE